VHEPPRRGRFALEPRDSVAVLAVVRVEHLDRDRARDLQVLRAVHARHPAAADDPIDPIPAIEHGAALERVIRQGGCRHRHDGPQA
jgi:hypothetical protein